jgi:hypothetical protein
MTDTHDVDPEVNGCTVSCDLFVQGCDASVLIKSTPNNTAERDAIPNQTLRGFDIVDEIKSQLEAVCPGIVSCADIIAIAAKDAVFQVSTHSVLSHELFCGKSYSHYFFCLMNFSAVNPPHIVFVSWTFLQQILVTWFCLMLFFPTNPGVA